MNEDKYILYKFFSWIFGKGRETFSLLILSYDDIYFTFMMHPGSCAKIRNQQNMILLLKRKFLLIIFLSLIQETRRLTWDNISFTFSVIFSSAIFYTHLLKYVKSNKCKYKILIFRHLFRCILSTRSDFWCIIFIDGTWSLIIMN